VIVTGVETVTVWEETVKVALVDPDGTVTFAGTVAATVLPLDRVTTAPPDGAAAVSVAVPWTAVPPVTLVGFMVSAERAGAAGVPCGVKLRTLDHEPAVPAALRPRTRHQCWRIASAGDVGVYWEAVTVTSITLGVENELESSTWI